MDDECDDLIEEVRRIREQLAARYNFDIEGCMSGATPSSRSRQTRSLTRRKAARRAVTADNCDSRKSRQPLSQPLIFRSFSMSLS